MGHGPATEWKKDNSASLKAKIGITMFLLYTIVYLGFIIINVFKPSLMANDIGNLNLAVVYGFGLIIFALLLAIIYNYFCTQSEKKMNKDEDVKDSQNGGNEE